MDPKISYEGSKAKAGCAHSHAYFPVQERAGAVSTFSPGSGWDRIEKTTSHRTFPSTLALAGSNSSAHPSHRFPHPERSPPLPNPDGHKRITTTEQHLAWQRSRAPATLILLRLRISTGTESETRARKKKCRRSSLRRSRPLRTRGRPYSCRSRLRLP